MLKKKLDVFMKDIPDQLVQIHVHKEKKKGQIKGATSVRFVNGVI